MPEKSPMAKVWSWLLKDNDKIAWLSDAFIIEIGVY